MNEDYPGMFNLCIPNTMFCNPYPYYPVTLMECSDILTSIYPLRYGIQSCYDMLQSQCQQTMCNQAIMDSMMYQQNKRLIDNICDLEQIVYGEVNPILEWRKEQERRIEEKYKWIEQIA